MTLLLQDFLGWYGKESPNSAQVPRPDGRSWVSRESEEEPTESEEMEQADRKRKRDVLEEIYQGFMSV